LRNGNQQQSAEVLTPTYETYLSKLPIHHKGLHTYQTYNMLTMTNVYLQATVYISIWWYTLHTTYYVGTNLLAHSKYSWHQHAVCGDKTLLHTFQMFHLLLCRSLWLVLWHLLMPLVRNSYSYQQN